MEVFNSALQIANLVATPSVQMLEAIKRNFEILGFSTEEHVLSKAPGPEWRETAVADAPIAVDGEPVAKRSRTEKKESLV